VGRERESIQGGILGHDLEDASEGEIVKESKDGRMKDSQYPHHRKEVW